MLGEAPLTFKGAVSLLPDVIAGTQHHKVTLPDAHQHPFLFAGSSFDGISSSGVIISGPVVGVAYNAVIVSTDKRPALGRLARSFANKLERSRRSDGKQNWSNLAEAQNYTHPPDIQLFSDQPIFDQLGNVGGQRIVDLGCGNGIISLHLARQGAKVHGVDVSPAMLKVASERAYEADLLLDTSFGLGTADKTSLATHAYDAAVCSLVINNISKVTETQGVFREAHKLLKSGGRFVIALPHPLTLNHRTNNRWTEWKSGQTQDSLQPGEAFIRKIKTATDRMLEIVNNFWHPEWLREYAEEAGLQLDKTIEATATDEQIQTHSLHELYREVPFFLVMSFTKP